MRHILFFALTACSGDAFVGIFVEGGLPEGDSSSESSTAADSGKDPEDSGGLDAREASDDSSTALDAKPDTGCPTGIAACDDAIVAFCSHMKACCNGTCLYAWQNSGGSQCAMQFTTGTCAGKTVCENICLNDIQVASCTTIKGSPSPAYVGTCMGLWQ